MSRPWCAACNDWVRAIDIEFSGSPFDTAFNVIGVMRCHGDVLRISVSVPTDAHDEIKWPDVFVPPHSAIEEMK